MALLAAAQAVDHYPLDTIAIFSVAFVFSLVMDLLQHKEHKEVTVSNAAGWSLFWVALSLGFWGWVNYRHGSEWGSMFLTGYVLEKTLSIDNLMVFIAIFKFFRIDSGLQHRILYFGILGAIVFRFIFVAIGTGFLKLAGPWALVVFGLFVAWAGIQMLRGGDDDEGKEPDYHLMPIVKFFTRFYPVFPKLVGDRFFVDSAEAEQIAKKDGLSLAAKAARYMTPAFVCLLVVEGSDVLFAFDSVPAVIAVTQEPLLVYTAMIFAILGLRSLYFILVVLTKYLAHLEKAIIYVLFYIAAKMFIEAWHKFHEAGYVGWELPIHIDPTVSMFIVLGMLGLGVVASFIWPHKEDDEGLDRK
ncbi:MAG: TerC/Alx family metal homeostasis membrane protein [Myxococcales bacterium]|nr:TerC/Alx family metal homeostasis membrane protein [Myxococcales bacterium]